MNNQLKKLVTLASIIGVIVLVFVLWWKNGVKPANSSDSSQQVFVVYKGQGIREISNELKKKGLIKDSVVFFLLVKKNGLDGKIQAGDFRISPSMSAFDIAQSLTHGTLDIWVTVPEGKRAEEIAEILKNKIPSYSPTWVETLRDNEGYLFPDTYLIPKDADIKLITSIMRNNFNTKFGLMKPTNKFTKEQIVIIASLVEREAKFPEDRPLVASVITNRLDIGMALQIDATVQYLLGFQKDQHTWWKHNLSAEDLRINSSYNTYIHPGLPPGPIANPGESALNAAITPSRTNYLYYLSDKSGKNHYANTLEEHNANIQKFGLQ